jgi:hypothetical protein
MTVLGRYRLAAQVAVLLGGLRSFYRYLLLGPLLSEPA